MCPTAGAARTRCEPTRRRPPTRGRPPEPHLLQVHGLHGAVHLLDDAAQVLRDLLEAHRRLHLGRDGVHARRQAQVVDGLVLLADGVLCVDTRAVRVVLHEGLRARA